MHKDEQVLRFLVEAMVDFPEQVAVERTVDDRGVLLTLTVAPADAGKVIGKGGINAQAIRTLVRNVGLQNGAAAHVKIMDPYRTE